MSLAAAHLLSAIVISVFHPFRAIASRLALLGVVMLSATILALVEGPDLIDTYPRGGALPIHADRERSVLIVPPSGDSAAHHALRSVQGDLGHIVGGPPALLARDDPGEERIPPQ